MYLHLGQETTVNTKDIIGIFDLDTCSLSKKTRDFLAQSEKKSEVINTSFELPKSFVLTVKKTKKSTVFVSQLSAPTLKKRVENGKKSLFNSYYKN